MKFLSARIVRRPLTLGYHPTNWQILDGDLRSLLSLNAEQLDAISEAGRSQRYSRSAPQLDAA
jgi:hypothetical protein